MIDNNAVINRQTENDSVNVTFTLVNKVYLCFCRINCRWAKKELADATNYIDTVECSVALSWWWTENVDTLFFCFAQP